VIADWSVEIGPECPSIDVPWEGWIDLRCDHLRHHGSGGALSANTLAEAQLYPELLYLLKLVNRGSLFTSKVDVFPVSREDADPEIAEAGEAATRFGLGSYVDLATDRPELLEFAHFEALTRMLAAKLGKIEVSGFCSAEIVLRPAHLFGRESFGWSVYVLGFGPCESAARQVWAAASAAALVSVEAEFAAFLA
jgi:hypothetical protein